MFLVLYTDVTVLTARKKYCFVSVNQFPIKKPPQQWNLNKWISITNASRNGLKYTKTYFDLRLQYL